MFVKPKEMCKLIKNAYKTGGLVVMRNMGYYIISPKSLFWELQVVEDELHNKIKSCIVELAGELPEEGTGFEIASDRAINRDVDMEEPYVAHPTNVRAEFVVTKLTIEEGYGFHRVIRNKKTGELTVVSELIQSVIDKTIDKSEDPVEGPYISEYHSQRIMWSNVTGAFNIMLSSYQEDSDMAAVLGVLNKTGVIL